MYRQTNTDNVGAIIHYAHTPLIMPCKGVMNYSPYFYISSLFLTTKPAYPSYRFCTKASVLVCCIARIKDPGTGVFVVTISRGWEMLHTMGVVSPSASSARIRIYCSNGSGTGNFSSHKGHTSSVSFASGNASNACAVVLPLSEMSVMR